MAANAAPKLRLSTAAVGPVSIATGATATQTIEAFNAGDGALNLRTVSSYPWLTASVGAPRTCTTRTGQCLPVTISINSISLPAGVRTGVVTISDSNAIDAPQNVTVTVQVGGPLPSGKTLVTAPGGTITETVTTGAASATSNSPWLTVSLGGAGTFEFPRKFTITARSTVTGEQTQSGQVTFAGSAAAVENRAIPITLRTTTQPILKLSDETLRIRVTQGTAVQKRTVAISNAGQGTLAVTGATVAATPGFLRAALVGQTAVEIAADPGTLGAGLYTGLVTVNASGAIPTATVGVELEVVAAAPPTAFAGQVLNNADFREGESVAPGGIVAIKGEHFFPRADFAFDTSWPRQLGGISVFVNGAAAPLYFANYNQINTLIPFETRAGEATIQVVRDGVAGNNVTVQVVERAPRIMQWFDFGAQGYAICAFNNELALALPPSITIPGFASRAARAGDQLVIYMLGLGQTNPPSTTGSAPTFNPPQTVPGVTTVRFGASAGAVQTGIVAEAAYAGFTQFIGLYQVNVQVPAGLLPNAAMPIRVTAGGEASNLANIAVQ
ncbi:MAG: hypothetical protein SFV18_18100 [Bryobacteraceae bacterium]|nr:hypothetical protein [Bryobacteraceae bacterium]